jgi:carboxymethylenebutenolidase
MKRRLLKIGLMIALVAVVTAMVVVRADAPKTDTVKFSNGTGDVTGFLATPAKPGRYPGIVVIHEWWGLTDWVKDETQKFAEQGYVAVAVDLYRGKVATDPEDAHELMRGLPQDRALADLQGAFMYLASRNDVDRSRIGTVGWCMGGGLALQLAIHQPHLAACVVNYGALPTDPNDLQQIFAPVLGNFGGQDRGITPADVDDFQKSMKSMSRRVDLKIYDDAGHAFENPTNKAGYRPDDAADAWSRSVAFLNKYLK